jgi:uncharacterized RDD family membrane protein YckC
MFCSKCGTQLADGAAFCTNCGQPTVQAAAPSPVSSPSPTPVGSEPSSPYPPPAPQYPPQRSWQTQAPAQPVAYAGFWLRLVAYVIDAIILGIVGVIAFFPLFRANIHVFMAQNPWEVYTSMSRPLFAFRLLALMLSWIYYASMESSTWQATLGKKILGLRVMDLAGNRITFARASGRFFGKILSGMILGIGFLMAGFTARKQALHDMLAGCLVLRQL